MDASTTVLELAVSLKETEKKLTIINNGLRTAIELKENPNISVIMIGGIARKGSMGLEGLIGIDILNKINIDVMFTSASGFTINEGLTDFNVYEVELKNEMGQHADKVIALLDHTKIGISSISSFASVDQLDTIITDRVVSEDMTDYLISKDIEVIY